MKVAIMQPYFFPYIGYWQLINAVDVFVIYDDVQFIKGGWINRNYILLNGTKTRINLPLIKASSNKNISEIEISNERIRYKKLLKTIEQAYSKTPYFRAVYPLLEQVILYDEKNLAKYLRFLLEVISKFLDMETNFIYSSDIAQEQELKGQERVLNICNTLNASMYINAIGGKDLYSAKFFNDYNIKLNFLKSEEIPYNQMSNSFVPWLSIIDVLMNNSIYEVKKQIMRCLLV
ncbi:WbqC family protein [Anoxynatronum buryatiense]|uniref:WbqC family protein n=1 Tax=Anoxynatronum buryatiense TaxID=489973 RepID=UPI0024B82992|nr:WbqC family protein [Anoxynatronum buryatiense]